MRAARAEAHAHAHAHAHTHAHARSSLASFCSLSSARKRAQDAHAHNTRESQNFAALLSPPETASSLPHNKLGGSENTSALSTS
jgi:hypothetical protein